MVSSQLLYKYLIKHFDLGELRELCFVLNVPFEDLQGGTRDSKALALIGWAERRGVYPQLVTQVQAQRPSLPITPDQPITPTAVPTNPPQFVSQLQQLHTLLQQALAAAEIGHGREAQLLLQDSQQALEEAQQHAPQPSRIKRRIEEIGEILQNSANTGPFVAQTQPVLTNLLKTVDHLF